MVGCQRAFDRLAARTKEARRGHVAQAQTQARPADANWFGRAEQERGVRNVRYVSHLTPGNGRAYKIDLLNAQAKYLPMPLPTLNSWCRMSRGPDRTRVVAALALAAAWRHVTFRQIKQAPFPPTHTKRVRKETKSLTMQKIEKQSERNHSDRGPKGNQCCC